MTCNDCLSEMSCASKLKEMYQGKAEKCPYCKNKADFEEVIRCKECAFWNREHISCEGLARCLTGESGIRFRGRNDFCSRGTRRTDNGL